MEVDHVPYIFGSFSRRRHSQNLTTSRKTSTGMEVCHTHSHSQPHVPRKKELDSGIVAQRTKSYFHQVQASLEEDPRYICTLCRGLYVEPRVLSCLHTFCTRCLQEIEKKEVWEVDSEASFKSDSPASGGSGYESSGCRPGSSPDTHHIQQQQQNVSVNNGDKLRTGSSPESVQSDCWLSCPLCNSRTALNRKGILGLPPNYILQHRIVLATLNNENTKLLCDLCTSDITATHRCSECLINLCDTCTEIHRRHKIAGRHELLVLRDAKQRGIMRIHRQIMCQYHPDQELVAYCITCTQVVCRECTQSIHANHACEPASRATVSRTGRMASMLQKSRMILDKEISLNQRLQLTHSSVENQCKRIEEEIENFIEAYRRALDEHREKLLTQVSQIREEKITLITVQQKELEKRISEAQNTVSFTEELLTEGSDIEILTFLNTILKKLETYNKVYVQHGNTDKAIMMAPRISESLHFLPTETVQYGGDINIPLYGTVTTQTVAPNQCILHKEGLENLRVHKKVELVLETRDSSGCPVTYGGESVTAELWYRDAGTSCRTLAVHVTDGRDGTYVISFTPDTPGKLSLAVSVRGQHIQDSPVPLVVRNLRPHRGTYHCCNFCSSGGNKDAMCACGGKMPGGYRGCGHGHEGHPGRRHWSCCGNVLENSECGLAPRGTMYQITL